MGLFDRFFRRPSQTNGTFGFAVVGLGGIAKPFLEQVSGSSTCRIAAVVSGDPVKAAATAKAYGAASIYSYAEFGRIAGDANVDAVYLALPVSLHREYTERAAAAGKHVLCEKPMAPTAADAQAMIAACRAAGVRIGIAYRCPHTGPYHSLRQLVRNGAFGERSSLRIESGFGFALKPGWRDSTLLAGGGSLWDVGIYPLNAARFLLGEEPVAVEDACAVVDENGLEREIRWTSVFPSGARAVCISSYRREIPDTLTVTGNHGSGVMDPAFRWQKPYRFRGITRDLISARDSVLEFVQERKQREEFALEAEELVSAAREGRDTICPGEDGLADLQAMEAIYRAAGVAVVPSA